MYQVEYTNPTFPNKNNEINQNPQSFLPRFSITKRDDLISLLPPILKSKLGLRSARDCYLVYAIISNGNPNIDYKNYKQTFHKMQFGHKYQHYDPIGVSRLIENDSIPNHLYRKQLKNRVPQPQSLELALSTRN